MRFMSLRAAGRTGSAHCPVPSCATPCIHCRRAGISPSRQRVSHTSSRMSWGCAARSPSTTNSSWKGEERGAVLRSSICRPDLGSVHGRHASKQPHLAHRDFSHPAGSPSPRPTHLLVHRDLPRAALALHAAGLLLDARQPGAHLVKGGQQERRPSKVGLSRGHTWLRLCRQDI